MVEQTFKVPIEGYVYITNEGSGNGYMVVQINAPNSQHWDREPTVKISSMSSGCHETLHLSEFWHRFGRIDDTGASSYAEMRFEVPDVKYRDRPLPQKNELYRHAGGKVCKIVSVGSCCYSDPPSYTVHYEEVGFVGGCILSMGWQEFLSPAASFPCDWLFTKLDRGVNETSTDKLEAKVDKLKAQVENLRDLFERREPFYTAAFDALKGAAAIK